MIGRLLSNRYEILKKIGDGGMALVYSAKDKLLNRLVAVKILREQYATDKEFIDRFYREAQAAASLSHPNVVNVYDVGQLEKTPYIVMEYIEGQNLSEIIKEKGMLSEEYVINIGIQICSALAHAHKHNIVHRDIKPHNILVTKDDNVKVTDFGIAAISSISITETGVVLGSVSYFSPEQARGNKVDHQSDLYSLGVVLYEMLCGKVPFRGDTPISIALKHIQEEPAPPAELNPKLGKELERIIIKLLNKKPKERYQSASELKSALEKINLTSNTQRLQFNITSEIQAFEGEEATAVSRGKRKKVKRRSLSVFLLLFSFIALSMYGLFVVVPKFVFPKDVEVPPIVGLSIDEAEIVLKNHGLRLSIETEVFDNEIPKNHVISQEPKATRMKKQGQDIFVRISKGPQFVDMPSFLGQSSREARLNLTQYGFMLGDTIPDTTSEFPINTVIGQFPEPGEEVQLGIAIDLIVSQGADVATTLILPDFRGSDLNEVLNQLTQLGLEQGSLIPEYNTIIPKDQIVEQNPPARTEVEVGWKIDLVYSQGLPGQLDSSPENDTVQRWTSDGIWRENILRIEIPEGPSQEVVIVVDDDFGSRDVYRQAHSGGSSFTYNVKGRGEQPRILVYIGGRLFIDRYFAE